MLIISPMGIVPTKSWEALIENEIVEAHRFFENWYNGTTNSETANFELNIANRFDPNFKIVMPDGTLYQRSEILPVIENGYGSSRSFKIEIKMISSDLIGNGLKRALYEEWHTEDDGTRKGRLSVVILKEDHSSSRLQWLHCHESPL